MNSNRNIEVGMTICNHCNNTFYEFTEYELSECPHCGEELSDGGFEVQSTTNVELEVDFKTGRVTTSW